ncbi:AraC family transcriptional regulator [Nocardioides zeae]|nr:AraC family transcriptional regulator [Nocardioides zeae]
MFSPTVAHDWHFPRSTTGIGVLLAWARANGIDPAPLLVGTGLSPDDLEGAEGEVTADQELTVVRALLRRRPDEPPARLGAAIGASYHLGSFGVFGFAMLASPTLLHAVDLATRYIDLSFTFAMPRAELEGDAETGTVQVHVDGATLPPDVRPLLVARDARAIGTALRELLPGLPLELRLEPVEAPRRAVVSFPASNLARPLPQGNPQTAAACEQLCAELVERRRSRRGLAQQVRVLAAQEVTGGAPAGVVARRLGLSERTLRRRLAAEGTSYSELLDEVRSGLAVGLLATDLSLDEVALRLGYAEASSFIHAHRRWTGRTPRQAAEAD